VQSPTPLSACPLSHVTRRLSAVVPGIFRNPDQSYTGVDVETIQVRVMNNGTVRTGAQVEWWSTSSDDIASLVKTDTLDINPGAVAIFARNVIPDGCTRCNAEIYSLDIDGPEITYGVVTLLATVSHRVVDAGNALAGGNAIQYEDLFPTGSTTNNAYIIPVVYKNYGGGAHKWNSIVSGCLTRGVPGAQPIVFNFIALGDTRGGPFEVSRSTNPGGCIVLNLATFDPNDPDYFDPLAGLPDGTYSVVVYSTAGTPIPQPPETAGGFFASSISYSISARMATMNNGSTALGNESQGCNQLNIATPFCTAPVTAGLREIYMPLVFKRYNDWNSGITVVSFRPRGTCCDIPFNIGTGGGSGSTVSIAMYGEDGTLFGVFLDSVGRGSARNYYLPTMPIQLPDGFRGSTIIAVTENTAGTRTGAGVMSVNYERNQAISYNAIKSDQLLGPRSPYTRPCSFPVNSITDPESPAIGPPNGLDYTSCLFVPDAERRFSGSARGVIGGFEVGLGPTTGVRMLNPDPTKTGIPSFIFAAYLDAAGLVYPESGTGLSLAPYHTATIFMGANTQLPDFFDGTMFIQATYPIAAIANVVDYRVTDRDASYAFNVPNQTGQTN
jgi:hypothetical protein